MENSTPTHISQPELQLELSVLPGCAALTRAALEGGSHILSKSLLLLPVYPIIHQPQLEVLSN